jgi:hypothetical protein
MPTTRSIRERLLCECDVDGFRSTAPDFAAYCPREKRKVLAAEHAACKDFGGYIYGMTGEEAGVRCLHPAGRQHH